MDRIESFPVACSGGLITNLSPIEQANQFPGSARELVNFECSLKGGYRRIKGYRKLNSSPVPRLARMLVKQAHSAGATSIVISDPFGQIESNVTFTIAGQATVYTVSSRSYYDEGRSATVNFSPALSANVSDKAVVTITGYTGIGASFAQAIEFYPMISSQPPRAYIASADRYFTSLSNSLDPFSANSFGDVPYHNGTTLVDGSGQTGTTLAVKGLAFKPDVGDTFFISGVTDVYSVFSATDLVGTQSTITLAQSLTSSPANNAAITWHHSGFVKSGFGFPARRQHDRFTLENGIENLVYVTGGYPILIEPLKGYRLLSSNSEVLGATSVAYHKDHLWFGVGNKVVFTAPFNVYSYDPALGAGVLLFDGNVTGLRSFREQLIIFTRKKIYRLTGSSTADFSSDPITEKIGCSNLQSIQEVGGDLAFQTNDGIRLLGATERLGDLNIGSITSNIQDKIESVIAASPTNNNAIQTSVVINSKSQYRIFRYQYGGVKEDSIGLIGTLKDQGRFEWAETKEFSVWSADHNYGFIGLNFTNEGRVNELTVFCNGYDPYLYQMDNGNTFDGTTITATYTTPFFYFNDPKTRKTLHSLSVSTERDVNIDFTANVLLDFNESDVIQPASIPMGNTSGIFGDNIGSNFETLLIGNGKNASIQFVSSAANTDFSFKDMTIEYSINDRR
jgi:hypothetical protein